MRLILFIILIVFMLPLWIVGVIIYTWRMRRLCVAQNISGTANEPFGARLMMHIAGTRPDDAAYKIAGYLPSYNKLVRFLLVDTTWLASKLSGYTGSMLDYPGKRPSSLLTMLSHRSDFFDRSINKAITRTENPVKQIVVLGSGYDTRCYDLPEGMDIQCFEVDMAPTLAAKKKAVQLAAVPHDHVAFVETDFNQETWMEALLAAGFNPDLTTYILWEGVTMYLVEGTVRDTLKLVATLAKGSVLGVDYFSTGIIEGHPPYEKLSKNMHKAIKYYGEKLQFGIPTGESYSEGLESLLKEVGLSLTEFEYVGSEKDKPPPWYFFAQVERLE